MAFLGISWHYKNCGFDDSSRVMAGDATKIASSAARSATRSSITFAHNFFKSRRNLTILDSSESPRSCLSGCVIRYLILLAFTASLGRSIQIRLEIHHLFRHSTHSLAANDLKIGLLCWSCCSRSNCYLESRIQYVRISGRALPSALHHYDYPDIAPIATAL